ncbi:MAG: hypothetical protein AB1916_06580 [Thermodesulfobacteriota bacterium]
MTLDSLWHTLGWPLARLVLSISAGLLIGNLIEALNWTRGMARLAAPLTRAARLQDISGASFSMAFFSGVAANTMLAEAYDQGRLTGRELVLTNLFNSTPTYFTHLPTMFFITVPFIGAAAWTYVGLTFLAALLRTAFIVLLGRLVLPPLAPGCIPCRLDERKAASWREAWTKSWGRFTKRIRKVLVVTLPIYLLFDAANRFGLFSHLERLMAEHMPALSWLPPQALSIVAFHVAAEFSAGLASAGALLNAGSLSPEQVVMALLAGNLLSTPMRAFRHQFPYYAGIFNPRLAARLIVHNQALRVVSLALVAAAYYAAS